MHCSRMLRLWAIPTALLLLTGVAPGQVPAPPDTPFGLPANEPLDLSTPLPDESKHKTVNPFASMPPASDWSSKAGIDYRKPSFPAADFQPGALTAGSVPDQSNGVAWATVTAPGFQFPLGWDPTSIETRVDPLQQQSKVGATLSRSVPVGENVTATLQNGLAVTSPLPNATTHDHGWTSKPVAAVQRLADRYQRVIGCQYFEHGRKVAALAERGGEAGRRTFQRNRLGERDSDRRDLEKPHRRLQAPVVISALGRLAAWNDIELATGRMHVCRGDQRASSWRRGKPCSAPATAESEGIQPVCVRLRARGTAERGRLPAHGCAGRRSNRYSDPVARSGESFCHRIF